jgi:hypothetical protein
MLLGKDGAKLVPKYHGKPEIPLNDKDKNEIFQCGLGHVVKQVDNIIFLLHILM